MKNTRIAMKVIACIYLAMCSACTPKYDIKYDFDPPMTNKSELAKKKLGICLFEDARKKIKPEDDFFQETWTVTDDIFQQKVPTMINNLVVNHFNHAFGNTSSVVKINHDCTSGKLKDLIDTIHSNKTADYILVGVISNYTSSINDKNAITRNFLGYIPGMVLLFDDDVENKTDMEFDNLLLIKVDGPQIVWKGGYKNNTVEPLRVFADRYEKLVQIQAINTKKAIQAILDNLLSSAENGFSQRYSVVESRRILNKIKVNRSLSDLGI